MQIILNGHPRAVASETTLADLVAELGIQGQKIAVELNGEIAPRTQYTETTLSSMDRVEVVHAIGGG